MPKGIILKYLYWKKMVRRVISRELRSIPDRISKKKPKKKARDKIRKSKPKDGFKEMNLIFWLDSLNGIRVRLARTTELTIRTDRLYRTAEVEAGETAIELPTNRYPRNTGSRYETKKTNTNKRYEMKNTDMLWLRKRTLQC